MAFTICEGQRMDMDFETREDVRYRWLFKNDWIQTSFYWLALKTRAMIAGANMQDQDHLYAFGINSDITFQIQDDLLDAFGDAEKVGKQTGVILFRVKDISLPQSSWIGRWKPKSIVGILPARFRSRPVWKRLKRLKNIQDTGLRNMHCRSEMRTTTWPNLM